MTSTSKPMLTSINPDNNFIKEAHSRLWLKLAKKGMNYLFSLYFLQQWCCHYMWISFRVSKCRSCICLLTVGQLIQLLRFINITLLLFKEWGIVLWILIRHNGQGVIKSFIKPFWASVELITSQPLWIPHNIQRMIPSSLNTY